ncbi:MAG: helix-turn-helix domain-containing protein [Clostridia bacterium]|nr:helix-turn-helix domain-containing protein [Clostridia bacterium]
MANTFYEKAADAGSYFRLMRYMDSDMSYRLMPHYHSSLEIFIVVRGEYYVYVNGERRKLTAGDIAFVDGFTPHTSGSTELVEGTLVYVAIVSPDYLRGVDWLEKQTLPPFIPSHGGIEDITKLCELSYRIFGGDDRCSGADEEMKRGFASLLLGALRSYCRPTARERDRSAEVTVEIMKYIGEHYAEDINLSTLAERFGYEKTYLSRVLNKTLNMNFREYLNRVRISAVKRLRAAEPHTSLYRLAEECGFKSENTFYRAYKRYIQ